MGGRWIKQWIWLGRGGQGHTVMGLKCQELGPSILGTLQSHTPLPGPWKQRWAGSQEAWGSAHSAFNPPWGLDIVLSLSRPQFPYLHNKRRGFLSRCWAVSGETPEQFPVQTKGSSRLSCLSVVRDAHLHSPGKADCALTAHLSGEQ